MSEEEDDLRAALRAYWLKVQGSTPTTEFAHRLGVSRSLVVQIRKGDRNVTVEHLALLARAQRKPVAAAMAEVLAILANPRAIQNMTTTYGEVKGTTETVDELRKLEAGRTGDEAETTSNELQAQPRGDVKRPRRS